jgi:hypothetical protein
MAGREQSQPAIIYFRNIVRRVFLEKSEPCTVTLLSSFVLRSEFAVA